MRTNARRVLARVSAFVRLTRPTFLAGGFVGGAFGTALAAARDRGVSPRRYALAQAAITAFHLMTHYANDYFDRAGDVGARRTPFSGGSGALVDGSLPPRVALVAARTCAACGVLAAAALVARRPVAGATAIALGTLAWCYSAPPVRLLGRGLGELDTAVVVSVLVPLCAYAAQGGRLDGRAAVATLPGAAAMFAMMIAVEYPDAAVDAASGKRNLIVRLGVRDACRLGRGAVAVSAAAVALAVGTGAPPTLAAFELLALAPGAALAAGFAEAPGVDGTSLAGRGVVFFFLVTFLATLAHAAESLG